MSNPAHALGICDRCGFKHPLNALRKEWTGLRVCKDCWEPRHPQDYVRGVRDDQALHDPRPRPADTFVVLPIMFSMPISSQYLPVLEDDD